MVGIDARAASVEMATMKGKCRSNSQFSVLSKEQMTAKNPPSDPFTCNLAVLTEFDNGRVVINVTDTRDSKSWTMGYSGYYSNKGKKDYLEVDGMYFIDPKSKDKVERKDSKGYCEIQYVKNEIKVLACLSATSLSVNTTAVSSSIFDAANYSKERVSGENNETSREYKPNSKEIFANGYKPWYGVAADGTMCVPTDISPAEKIEWLRKQGIKYDAIDYSAPLINGRVPKVTIIPKDGRYQSSAYYATKEFCEEKEVSINKYR